MKLSNINPLNFQKKLKANCRVLKKEGKPEECGIYLLKKEEDKDYFKDIKKGSKDYINYVKTYASSVIKGIGEVYAIENDEGRRLGAFIINQDGEEPGYVCLDYISTLKKQNYGLVGETLLSYLAQKAVSKNKELRISSIAPRAMDFYERCGVEIMGEDNEFLPDGYLSKKGCIELSHKNEEHCGKMDFLG